MKPALILCGSCAITWAADHPDEDYGLYLAATGPTPGDEDESILVCVPWLERNPLVGSTRRKCGRCGLDVAVARSSLWLLGETLIPPI